MGPLNKYDVFLILVTAPVNCAMPIAPWRAASAADTVSPVVE